MQSNIEITPSFVLIVGCFVLVFTVASYDDSKPTLKIDTRVEKVEAAEPNIVKDPQLIRRPIDFKKSLDDHQQNIVSLYSQFLGGEDDLDIIRLHGVVSIDSKPTEGMLIFYKKVDDPRVLEIWAQTTSPITFLKHQYSLTDSSTPNIRLAVNNTLQCKTGTQDIFVQFHDEVPKELFTLITTYQRARTGWWFGGKKRKSLKKGGQQKKHKYLRT